MQRIRVCSRLQYFELYLSRNNLFSFLLRGQNFFSFLAPKIKGFCLFTTELGCFQLCLTEKNVFALLWPNHAYFIFIAPKTCSPLFALNNAVLSLISRKIKSVHFFVAKWQVFSFSRTEKKVFVCLQLNWAVFRFKFL